MIDSNMMNNIIDALSKHTKLILVGDFNQLPAVNNGLILKDLCANANNTYSTKITILLKKINQCYIQRNASLNKKILSTDHICILQKKL
ncbi:AAA family ATPase [Buchnera aphidicola (Hormaphis cornu)]|nr:AAA family ATPase [Buchnera aphidicola (Hormaphis cornu)]